MLILQNPVLQGENLSYQVKVLEGEMPGCRGRSPRPRAIEGLGQMGRWLAPGCCAEHRYQPEDSNRSKNDDTH